MAILNLLPSRDGESLVIFGHFQKGISLNVKTVKGWFLVSWSTFSYISYTSVKMAQTYGMIEIGGAKVFTFWPNNKILLKFEHLHL